jgi:hypothetical protein
MSVNGSSVPEKHLKIPDNRYNTRTLIADNAGPAENI